MSSISESLAALALGVLFPAALLFAQPQAAPAPVEANQSLTGTVVNSVTGEPVRRALVSFAQWSTLTDGDGRFEFHDLPHLQTPISVRKPGFFSEQDVAGGQLPENMVVTSGSDPAPIEAKLIPEGVVFGRVESEAGPIEGTQVKLLAARVRDGERHWEQQGFAITGDDGSFRIANLMPGSYYLLLAANTSPELSGPGNPPKLLGYSESYYPGVQDTAAATALVVAPGQQLQADISAKLAPVFQVSGTVMGFTPDSGISVQFATDSGDVLAFPTEFDDNGNFRSRLPGGSYILMARGQGPDNALLAMDMPLELTGDLRGIKLALAPSSPIPVNLRFVNVARKSSSVAIVNDGFTPGAVAASPASAVNIQLESTGPTLRPLQFFAMRESPAEQKLVLRNVEAGRYRVKVQPGFNWYPSSVRCGDVDLLRDSLEVRSGMRSPPIEVELRNDGANLRVSAFSEGAPAAGWVLLLPLSSPAGAQAQPVSVGTQAIFSNLPPGEYSLLAFDQIAGLEYKELSSLSQYLGRATRVVLSSHQDRETKLEILAREK